MKKWRNILSSLFLFFYWSFWLVALSVCLAKYIQNRMTTLLIDAMWLIYLNMKQLPHKFIISLVVETRPDSGVFFWRLRQLGAEHIMKSHNESKFFSLWLQRFNCSFQGIKVKWRSLCWTVAWLHQIPMLLEKGGVILGVFLETVGSPSRTYQKPHNLGEQDESQRPENPMCFFGLHFCLARTGGFTSEETWAQTGPKPAAKVWHELAGARSMFSTVFPEKKTQKKDQARKLSKICMVVSIMLNSREYIIS